MTTQVMRPVAVVEIDGDDFIPRTGDVSLDSSRVPYAQATVELPLLDDATLEYLDPRDAIRCPIDGGDGGVLRTFNLGLRSRQVDYSAKTVTLNLASDEAILQRYTALADDPAPLALASSLRAVVNYVLGVAIPGAALESGGDVNVTPLWDAVNVLGNPSFEVPSTTGIRAGTSASALQTTSSAGFQVSGTYSMRWTSTIAGTSSVIVGLADTSYRGTPGRWYSFSVYLRSSIARTANVFMRFLDADGNPVSSPFSSATTSTSAWTRITVVAQAPAGTTNISPLIATAANTAGQFHYADAMLLTEGPFVPPYFDGSTADTASYQYDWLGGVSASASTRTALVETPEPDAFVWKAGQSAWDFLMPLAASAGMVIWCDENRDWFMALPEDRSVPSTVFVIPANTRDGSDTIDLDADTTITGVVVRYTWTDVNGLTQVRIDAAGTEDNVRVVELAQAFPGPGTAAAILARQQGTGRQQDVTNISDWSATPGMTVQINLPGAPETTGRLVAVRWDMAVSFMQVTAAGLVDSVPGSVASLTGMVSALPGMVSGL